MPIVTTKGWTDWLNNHNTRKTYDDRPEKVTKICTGTTPEAKFEKLVSNKNLVYIARQNLGTKLQATFLHSTIGIAIDPDSLHYVARSSMKFGIGIEVDPKSMFESTPSVYVPDLVEMMKAETKTDYGNLQAVATGTKKKIPCYTVLTPSIAEALQSSDMSPADAFLKAVAQIKISAPNPDPNTIPVPTADEIMKEIGTPYKNTLLFLWATHHIPNEISIPTTIQLQDEVTIAWEKETSNLITDKNRTATATSTPSAIANSGAVTAMTKLSESIIEHQKSVIRMQEDKQDNRLKAWRKLPKIQQNVILLGGIEEDGTVPKECTEEMLSVLGSQNGAQVEQYLRQTMPGHNMQFATGFCTALNKGILTCPDDASTPKNFTPFLTPPVDDDADVEENANLLKMAVQDKFEAEDLILLTRMDITIPMKTQELKHHIKNFAACAGRCLGQRSIAYDSLLEVAEHIEKKETAYNYEFKQEPLFGGNFLDKLSWRFHRFLDSCAFGDESKIDSKKLVFADMMEEVERREYTGKTPAWIRKLTKKKEEKSRAGTGSESGHRGHNGHSSNGRPTRRQFNGGEDSDRNRRIQNPHMKEEHKLRPNEQLRDLFHPGNVRGLTRPKFKNGAWMCTRFHGLGFCFKDCHNVKGHAKPDDEEAADLRKYINGARENRQRYTQRIRGNNNRDNSRQEEKENETSSSTSVPNGEQTHTNTTT